jgi:hypothetical protein
MKRLITAAVGLLVSLSASTLFAVSATDNNKTIVRIGTQATQAYIELSPALTIAGGCLFGIAYVENTSTAEGKAFYATLLTAYSQGKPLSRVDYGNSASGGQCFITLLEIQ